MIVCLHLSKAETKAPVITLCATIKALLFICLSSVV
jgi:hypothetical protein